MNDTENNDELNEELEQPDEELETVVDEIADESPEEEDDLLTEDEIFDGFTLDDDETEEVDETVAEDETEETEETDETEEPEGDEETVEGNETEPEPEKTPVAKGLEKYEEFNSAARENFKQKFGVDYDQFEDSHKDALTDIKSDMRKADNAVEQINLIADKNGGEAFTNFLVEKQDNLTVKQAREMAAAEAKGDYSKTFEMIAEWEKEFKNGSTKDQANKKAEELKAGIEENKNGTVNPPVTMGSGTGQAPAKRATTGNVLTLDELGMG